MVAEKNYFSSNAWHNFAKGAGAGGDVKNAVWRKVLQNKAVVGDLESCFCCQRKVS